MNIHYCSYADGEKYEIGQDANAKFAAQEGFAKMFLWKKSDLVKCGIWKKYENIFDVNLNGGISNGGCAWKPLIILNTLLKIPEDDILLYADCGDLLKPGILNFVTHKIEEKGILLVQNIHRNLEWTKTYCFIAMECVDQQFEIESKYGNVGQLEAGIVAFKNNKENMDFVKKWLNWCLKKDVVLDDKMGFEDAHVQRHSRDQSILTNLALKENKPLTSIYEIMQYVQYNYYG